METIFRFMVARAPKAVDEKNSQIPLFQNTELQDKLKKAYSSEKPLENYMSTLRKYTTKEKYINSPVKLNLHRELIALREQIENTAIASLPELETAIFTKLGDAPSDICKSKLFIDDRNNLADSIITMKLLPEENNKLVLPLIRIFQTMHLINLVSEKDIGDDVAKTIKDVLNAILLLPDKISTKLNTSSTADIIKKKKEKNVKYKLYKEAVKKAKDLEATIDELMNLRSKDLTIISDETDDNVINLKDLSTGIKTKEKTDSKAVSTLKKSGASDNQSLNGKPTVSKVIIKPEIISVLSSTTKAVLEKEQILPDKISHEDILFTLERRLKASLNDIAENKPSTHVALKGVKNGKILFADLEEGEDYELTEETINDADERFRKPGTIKPIGVGDLLIVKQQLVRYEGGDIAHIENILKSEKKNRTHRTLNTTEQYSLMESETSKEESRDLESTERFEMQKEAEKTIEERSNLEVGLNVTATYGPVSVSANFGYQREKAENESIKTASDFSKEIINKSASKISEKIHKTQSTLIKTEYEEINEHGFNNESGTEHVAGVYQWINKVYEAQVYNYGIRELYDVIIPEPGEFLLKALANDNIPESLGLKEPKPFRCEPSDLKEKGFFNYEKYIERYNVTGVEPPPPPFKTVAMTFYKKQEGSTEGETEPPKRYTEAMEIEIPSGYQAESAKMNVDYIASDFERLSTDLNNSLDNSIPGDKYIRGTIGACNYFSQNNGKYQYSFESSVNNVKFDTDTTAKLGSSYFHTTLDFYMLNDETDSIPVTIFAENVDACIVSIEIKCKRTDRHLKEWQHTTHSTIMQAYLSQKAVFEEKCAAHSISKGVQITGKNPLINRELEKNELKKCCLAMIMGDHFENLNTFEKFDAIEEDPVNGLPRINLEAAEQQGKYIRFLEQAFEWTNLTFNLYPYFWSRKSTWKDKIIFNDTDKQFVDFISAGAARVVIPARPGFENAIRHFIATGKPWEGGDLPSIEDDPLYVPIIKEIQAKQENSDEEAQLHGTPYPVVIPTSLVRLRSDNSLPEWIKDPETGNWVPKESVISA